MPSARAAERAARGAPPAHEPLRRRLHRAATPARRPRARRTSGASTSGSARSTRWPTPACFTSRSAAARARRCPGSASSRDHARARGIIPNLTTSRPRRPRRARRDRATGSARSTSRSTGSARPTRRVRGFDGFARADAAIARAARGQARDRHQRRRHAPQLRRARRALRVRAPSAGCREVELLRFKPSGRGARAYEELRCTDAQHRAFLADDPRRARSATACASRSTARTRRCSRTTRPIARCSPSSPSTAAPAATSSSARRRRASHRVQLRRAARGKPARRRDIGATGSRTMRSARSAPGATPREPCRAALTTTCVAAAAGSCPPTSPGTRGRARSRVPARVDRRARTAAGTRACAVIGRRPPMKTVIVISDATGETAERGRRAALLQFRTSPCNPAVLARAARERARADPREGRRAQGARRVHRRQPGGARADLRSSSRSTTSRPSI